MNDEQIRAAWEAYHGPINDIYGDEIPQAPPAYERGYRDGQASLADEVRSVLEQLDRIGGVWCDCVEFKECRDRLRALLPEGK